MRRAGWMALALTAAGFCFVGGLGSTEIFLGVTKTEATRIPAYVSHVEASSGMAGSADEVRSVLEADLRRSLLFRIVTPTKIDGVESARNPKPDWVRAIGAQGIEAVIWVSLTARGSDLVMEGRVYDGGSAELIINRRYTGEAKAVRSIVHRFADEIVFRYTGEKGIARTRIAYTSTLTGTKELYLMDYDGYNPRRITGDRSLNLSPDWSPDGRWLTYTSYRDGNPDLFTLDLETGRRWKMAGFRGLNISPAWSPDGKNLAFASTKDGPLQVYLQDRSGGRLRPLTTGYADSLSPSWSPNGREIAFVSNRGGTPQLYVINIDGTAQRRLTFRGDYNTAPAWSPKGDWIAYTCEVEGRMRVCLITSDGAMEFQLTDGPGQQEEPFWAPDGRHLVYRSSEGGGWDLYMVGIGEGEVERLTFNGAQNGSPAWSN